MARSRLWKLAATMTVAVSGCALCDTCDEPPVPCNGPGCNAALNVAPAPFVAAPTATGSFTAGTMSSRPPAPAEGTPPAFTAPPLPTVPADQPASPPPGPTAPEKP